jgi:hypothetical protein
MRSALALLVVVAACGRIGFDLKTDPDDASPPDDGIPPGDAMTPPALACGETRSAGAAAITGSGLKAVVTARGLAALWIDPGGVLRGAIWKTDADGAVIAQSPLEIAPGPFTQLWAAANDDAILVATQESANVTGHFLKGDLTALLPSGSLGTGPLAGRDPIARRRGGPGFVAIANAAPKPAIYEIDGGGAPVSHPLEALAAHGVPSIAADLDSYAVITEYADQFGPGCWYSKVDDAFVLQSGPGSVESTQQADCDSSTVSATAGSMGVGIAWMDRDPVNSYVELRGTAAGGNVASMSGELNVELPLVTATATGFAAIYRSSAGLRAFDAAGTRTLSPTAVLADLVTWADRAIVVWTSATGAPQLTRLCP